jgi:hypothetical protein
LIFSVAFFAIGALTTVRVTVREPRQTGEFLNSAMDH